MRNFFVSLLLLNVAGSHAQDCYSSLSPIQDIEIWEVGPDDLDTPRVYVLCPDTVFTTKSIIEGRPIENVEGDFALFLRSGATVKCGESGASSNNCIIFGGSFGVSTRYLSVSDAAYPKSLTASIQGVTFEGLTTALQIRGYETGEFTLEDCVFTGMRTELPFVLSGSELLIEGSENPTMDEALTECDPEADRGDFNFTFRNCTFEGNSQLTTESPSAFTANYMVTTCPGQTIVLSECIFQDNDFTRDSETFETSLVATFSQDGAPAGGIIVERTCFLNNKINGAYPVQTVTVPNETDTLVSIDTYVDEASQGETPLCEGFAVYDTEAEDREVLSCVQPGSSWCQLTGTAPPTSAPTTTDAPITTSPTSGPETTSPTSVPATGSPSTAPPTSDPPMSSPTSSPTTSAAHAKKIAPIVLSCLSLVAMNFF